MQFLDDSLLSENQQQVIEVASRARSGIPADPVTMDAQVQRAVDCSNAGATLLVHSPAAM